MALAPLVEAVIVAVLVLEPGADVLLQEHNQSPAKSTHMNKTDTRTSGRGPLRRRPTATRPQKTRNHELYIG